MSSVSPRPKAGLLCPIWGRDDKSKLEIVGFGKSISRILKKYIKDYPKATVVNIGCGLDTTFSRVDNGKIKWYNLDLPDVIKFRKELIAETPRSKNISKSVFDYSWFNDIDFNIEDRIFFFAGGFLYYFVEPLLQE